ncbi:enhanced intracellular survival protein Eis [Lapidilactobacillus mulanensis]|uniref:Enhanced intracellular survival protein Eis n=1 Tax=Lapidilactobacillus mulanensis TaxID=2485999 RepID=A0ABW4DJQ2_9LACO|nr:GNAT family N-acetyltransferase [Lapidilactobacillus mulanensis]
MAQVVEIAHDNVALLTEYFELCVYGFDKSNDEGSRAKWFNLAMHSHNYVLIGDDQHVKSGIMVTNLPVNWQGQEFLMGAVGYVASYPEFGGHGAITQLMAKASEQMAQDGVLFSYLAPFSYTFYRRFGYEEIFDRVSYQVKAEHFPKMPKNIGGSVVRGNYATNMDKLEQIYAQHPQSQSGAVVRADWWQQYRFSKNPKLEVAFSYDEQKELDGYVLYERTAGQVFEVIELMPLTMQSRQRLLSFVGKHASAYPQFTYESANQTLMNDLMPEAYHIQTTITPYMMARVNDWVQLIAQWRFTADLEQPITIHLQDDFLATNDGYWQLSVVNGQGRLEPTAEQQAVDLTIDTRQLIKVLTGYRTLNQLMITGQITDASADALSALQRALNYNNKPMLWDYF